MTKNERLVQILMATRPERWPEQDDFEELDALVDVRGEDPYGVAQFMGGEE
jgi:hypothetical protein